MNPVAPAPLAAIGLGAVIALAAILSPGSAEACGSLPCTPTPSATVQAPPTLTPVATATLPVATATASVTKTPYVRKTPTMTNTRTPTATPWSCANNDCFVAPPVVVTPPVSSYPVEICAGQGLTQTWIISSDGKRSPLPPGPTAGCGAWQRSGPEHPPATPFGGYNQTIDYGSGHAQVRGLRIAPRILPPQTGSAGLR